MKEENNEYFGKKLPLYVELNISMSPEKKILYIPPPLLGTSFLILQEMCGGNVLGKSAPPTIKYRKTIIHLCELTLVVSPTGMVSFQGP